MFKVYNDAGNLPEMWDDLAGDNPFLKRDALQSLEQLNPCSQSYHLNQENKIALVSYKFKIDLLTFSKYLSFKIPVNIIGIPMSVSKCGYSICGQSNKADISKYVRSLKGFYLILNSDDELNFAKGSTLPTCKIAIVWDSFDDYLQSMRSHYRHRVKKALRRFSNIQVEALQENKLFDENMYSLYLNVYEKSSEKLEKMPMRFFKNYPSKIFTFKDNSEVIGFIQLVENGDELIFLFGGFKHRLNLKYDLYMNMLLLIVRYGIENGYRRIDLGQTAEETKLKLGALQRPKSMYLHHSNPVFSILFGKLAGRFSYKHYKVTHTVFKGEEDENPVGKMS